MKPDFSNYSIKELNEALSAIDRALFPERVKEIEFELEKRLSNETQIDEHPLPVRFNSKKKYVLVLISLLAVVLTFILLPKINTIEYWLALIILGACIVILFIAIYQKSGWVEINESGVDYQNIWGRKEFKWDEISLTVIKRIKFNKLVILQTRNGSRYTLPASGSDAQKVSEIINDKILRKGA